MNEKTIHNMTEKVEDYGDDSGRDYGGGTGGSVIKFGWFEGVFMRCLLNIWGVMLFLRLTWVVGQAGLMEGLAIITLSNIVTTITSISMSAVSTNGQIKAGGIYYMISRSLGPEFGGAIGLMFTLANAIAVAMYIIGFCESLMDMLTELLPGFEGIGSTERINDIRLIGSVSLVLILGLAIVGMEWVTRVQMFLLFLLLTAQVDFIIGSFLPPSDDAMSKGFVGYNSTVFEMNLWSDYAANGKTSFFTVFAVFFPAVTGIVAGANLSGDLKDPGVAIPKGTLLAIGTTYVSYIIYAIMVAGCSLRYASGVVEEVHLDIFNETDNITQSFDDCNNRSCEFGISVSQQMMVIISAWGPLIYAGCFAATISSAIASLVGAPRVFQAVAKDKLFPLIASFGEGWGANNDPLRGYILVFAISLVCILIGDLNYVSSLLSNFFVAAYALINFSVFHASITNSPGWRPSFRYYNKWISLLGTALCIVVMFLMDYWTALITFVCIVALYVFVLVRNPDVNWGSSTQSHSFISALRAVQTLARVEDHVKNFRPKLIVMSGNPADRPCLVDFSNLLTKRLSLLECAEITDTDIDWKKMAAMKKTANQWLVENNIKAFFAVTRNAKFSEGVRVAIELSGLGKLSPNMMLIGFNQKWKSDRDKAQEYFNALKVAIDLHLAVGVLRIQGGLDVTKLFSGGKVQILRRMSSDSSEVESSTSHDDRSDSKMSKDSGVIGEQQFRVVSSSALEDHKTSGILAKLKGKKELSSTLSIPHNTDKDVLDKIIQYRSKDNCSNDSKTIDVYWLYDDGGLTLLLPHILTTRSKFARCKLRVFFLSDKLEDLDVETRNMAALLAKFRIAFQDVILLPDVTKKSSRQTREEFRDLVGDVVSEADLSAQAEKTNFHLRIAEIVRQNSSEAELVVMTLPLPKKVPPTLYLAWLDFTTRRMPPFFFVRGNQESVLTFYS